LANTAAIVAEVFSWPHLSFGAQIKVSNAFYFSSCVLDIFVSYNIWFMLDKRQRDTVMLKDQNTNELYAMMNVIDVIASSRNPLLLT